MYTHRGENATPPPWGRGVTGRREARVGERGEGAGCKEYRYSLKCIIVVLLANSSGLLAWSLIPLNSSAVRSQKESVVLMKNVRPVHPWLEGVGRIDFVRPKLAAKHSVCDSPGLLFPSSERMDRRWNRSDRA